MIHSDTSAAKAGSEAASSPSRQSLPWKEEVFEFLNSLSKSLDCKN